MITILVLIAVLWVLVAFVLAAGLESQMPETSLLSRFGAVLTRDQTWLRVARSTHRTRST